MNPSLTLPVGYATSVRFRVGDGEVRTEGCDDRVFEHTVDAFDVPATPECRNGLVSQKCAVRSVTQSKRAVPEERIKRIQIVCRKRFLIGHERLRDFSHNRWNVDLHV